MVTSLSTLAVAAYLVVANFASGGAIEFVPFGSYEACEDARQKIVATGGMSSQRAYVCVKAK